jgi:hypothetical protein
MKEITRNMTYYNCSAMTDTWNGTLAWPTASTRCTAFVVPSIPGGFFNSAALSYLSVLRTFLGFGVMGDVNKAGIRGDTADWRGLRLDSVAQRLEAKQDAYM